MTDYTRKPLWVNGHRLASIRDAAIYMELVLRDTIPDAMVRYNRLAYAVRAGQEMYLGFTIATKPPRVHTRLAGFWTPGTPLLRGHCTHWLGGHQAATR